MRATAENQHYHQLFALVSLLLACVPSVARAQLQVSTIRGVVHDARQQPVAGALVTLQDSRRTDLRSVTSAVRRHL